MPNGTRIVACRNSIASGVTTSPAVRFGIPGGAEGVGRYVADRIPGGRHLRTGEEGNPLMLTARGPGDGKATGPDSDVGQCMQRIEEPLDVGRGSCTDDRHDDGRRPSTSRGGLGGL